MGTAHIVFGRYINYSTGGRNCSSNHIDFLVDKFTVIATFPDGRKLTTVRDCKLFI